MKTTAKVICVLLSIFKRSPNAPVFSRILDTLFLYSRYQLDKFLIQQAVQNRDSAIRISRLQRRQRPR